METPKHSLPLPGLKWRGFTLQIFLLTILPLSILLVGIVFASQSLHHDAMRSLVGDRDLRAVRTAANSLSEEALHRAHSLTLLAQSDLSQGLDNLVSTTPALAVDFSGGLALFGADGNLREVTAGSAISAMDTAALAVLVSGSGELFSVPFEVTAGSGEWWLLASSVRPDGTKLVGAFSPAALTRQAFSGAVDPAQATVELIAPDGTLLYHSGPQMTAGHGDPAPGRDAVLRGESGIDFFHTDDGEHVVAFSPLPVLGWGLVLEETWESISSPLLNTTQSAPLLLAPLLLLALLGLWFGARQIVQPLQKLQTGAAELARGNFDAIKDEVGGISEIRMLQSDLAAMARELQAAQDSLRSYIGALTAGVESERLALARELHDDTLQTLISLNQRVQLTRLTGVEDSAALQEFYQQVQQTITNLRRMVRGLRPIYLEDLGLTAALEMLTAETARASGVEIIFQKTGAERRLPAKTELALYRMAQEVLSNISRHSEAATASLSLEFQPDAVTLSAIDDGRGFTLPASTVGFASSGHFGLLGLHERAEIIGAELEIQSAPGKGTRVVIRCPASE